MFAFFSIGVGIYPFLYLLTDMSQGLLSSKPEALIKSFWYMPLFYTHILVGAISLLSGWSQFWQRLRSKNLNLHRNLGKVYIISVFISGLAALIINPEVSGDIIAKLGFGLMAIVWLYTTLKAYLAVKAKDISAHQIWMIRSFAVCWAAVTLRIWLPIFDIFTNMSFDQGYTIVA